METSRVMPIPEDAWGRLRNEPPQGEMLFVRQALPDVDHRVLAAVDKDSRRHILLALDSEQEGHEDTHSRGVSITTRVLSGSEGNNERFIDLVCKDGSGHSAFNVIGGEIAERLQSGLETPAECVNRVISKWRRFWGQAPKKLLSKEQQIGLFAEVWFLLFWLVPRRGTSSVISWRGPLASRHDFEWPSRSVEVKATLSPNALIHRIANLSQLSPPEHGDLLLFSLRVREEAGAQNTLSGLIALGRDRLYEDSTALDHFDLVLENSGYSPLFEQDYLGSKWRVVDELLFRVEDDFPRLTQQSLRDRIPPGVDGISYDINLSSFQHLCVARSPEDGFAL